MKSYSCLLGSDVKRITGHKNSLQPCCEVGPDLSKRSPAGLCVLSARQRLEESDQVAAFLMLSSIGIIMGERLARSMPPFS